MCDIKAPLYLHHVYSTVLFFLITYVNNSTTLGYFYQASRRACYLPKQEFSYAACDRANSSANGA